MTSSYFLNVFSDTGKKYFLQSIWNNNNLILTLIDDFTAFKSNVSENKLKNLANKYDVNFKQYIEEIKCSLSDNINNIVYKINKNIFTISKKHENIIIQFADFILEEAMFNNTIMQIVGDLFSANHYLKNETLLLRKEKEIAGAEKNKFAKKLEEYSYNKKNMEHELYCKFILVLNEKKKRIQYLQELLKTANEKGKLNVEMQQHRKMIETKNVISNSDTETSDDEPAEKVTHNVQIERSEKLSKKKIDYLNDDEAIVNKLPKRAKVIDSFPENFDKVVHTPENKICINEEISNSFQIPLEANKNYVDESLNFNTEDLLNIL